MDLVTAKKEVLLYTSSDCLFSAKADAWNEAVNEFNVGATQTRIKDALTTLFYRMKVAVKRAYREWNQGQTSHSIRRTSLHSKLCRMRQKEDYSLMSQELHLHHLNRPPQPL